MFASLAVVGAVATGCGQGTQHSNAPVIEVVTTIFPLAEAARAVGGGNVNVIAAVPPGANPRTYQPGAVEQATLRRAAVVVDVGGGFQPALEAAVRNDPHVVSMAPALGPPDQGAWLDPVLLGRVGPVLSRALIAANPGARATYRNGAANFASEMQSLAADFQQTLSDCPDNQIVTADTTTVTLARQYQITDHVIGADAAPTGEQLRTAESTVRASGTSTVFREPWVPNGTVTAAADATHTKVQTLDTLEGPPPGGWPKGATYTALVEEDLGRLSSSLRCAQMGQS